MVSNPRKLLLSSILRLDDKQESCYLCYVCPDYCVTRTRPPPSPPPPKYAMQSIIYIMLCVLAASLLFISYLIARYTRRSDSSRSENYAHHLFGNNPQWFIQTSGLPKSTIESIGVVRFEKGAGVIQGSECCVCLNEFREDESLRVLPYCSHAFHVLCIDTWLNSNTNCPVCRAGPIIGDVVETVSGNSGSMEVGRSENGDGLVVIGDEKTSGFGLRNEKFRVRSDLGDLSARLDRELGTIRRSVSMDFSPSSSCKKHRCSGVKTPLQED